MKTINEKIDAAQKHHDEQLKVLEEKHEKEKADLTDKIVDSVLGGFLK